MLVRKIVREIYFTFSNIHSLEIEELDASHDSSFLDIGIQIIESLHDSIGKVVDDTREFHIEQTSKGKSSDFWVIIVQVSLIGVDCHDSQFGIWFSIISKI